MPAEPEHVRPGPQPQPLQFWTAAQLPGRPDELGHMGGQPVQVVQVVGAGYATEGERWLALSAAARARERRRIAREELTTTTASAAA